MHVIYSYLPAGSDLQRDGKSGTWKRICSLQLQHKSMPIQPPLQISFSFFPNRCQPTFFFSLSLILWPFHSRVSLTFHSPSAPTSTFCRSNCSMLAPCTKISGDFVSLVLLRSNFKDRGLLESKLDRNSCRPNCHLKPFLKSSVGIWHGYILVKIFLCSFLNFICVQIIFRQPFLLQLLSFDITIKDWGIANFLNKLRASLDLGNNFGSGEVWWAFTALPSQMEVIRTSKTVHTKELWLAEEGWPLPGLTFQVFITSISLGNTRHYVSYSVFYLYGKPSSCWFVLGFFLQKT